MPRTTAELSTWDGKRLDTGALEATVHTEQIRLLTPQRLIAISNALIACAVSIAIGSLYPAWLVMLWLSLFCAVILARFVLQYHYEISARDAAATARRAHGFVLGALLMGCLWGLTGSVVFMTTHSAYYLFVAFVLGGMVASGIVGNAAYLPAMFSFMLPALLPMIAVLVTRPGAPEIEMGLMLAAFAVAIAAVGQNINKTIVENLRLRITQNDLSVKLRASQDAMIEAQAMAHVGSWERDPRTGSVTWSPEMYRILGVDPATAKASYQTMLDRVHPADRIAVARIFSAGGELGRAIDHRIVMDDGAIKWIHQGGPIPQNGNANGPRMLGIVQDITERKNGEDMLQFANLLLTTEMEASPDGILAVDVNRNIISFNQRYRDMWNIPLDVLEGGSADGALKATMALVKDPADYAARMQHLYNHPDETGHDEIEAADGRIIERHTLAMRNPTGENLGRIWFFRDITRRKRAEDELQYANILLTTEMEASPEGILVVDRTHLKITSFNRRFADMWNVPLATLAAGLDETVLAIVTSSVKDPRAFYQRVQYLNDHPGESGIDEVETNDGRYIQRHSTTLTAASGANLGRIWFFNDITERKKAEELAIRMARFDVLTGLANRGVFVEAVQHAIADAKRDQQRFAVIYFDLDHFKDINDTLGHPLGDELLKAVAQRLRAATRETDTVARFGGDEFAVVAAGIGRPADAAILADKLIKAIGEPYSIEGNDLYTGASMGIDLYGPEAPDAETLLSHADVALYRAKSEGRGTYRFFTKAMDRDVRMRVTLGAELRDAIDMGQLLLLYQPQVSVVDGRITGVEALVRWHHPTRGMLGPDIFIPVAEQTGVIGRVDHWVMASACRQAKLWLDAGIAPSRIAVNVSALQFKVPSGLESEIVTILAETGLPAGMLELELTETALMDVSQERGHILERIREIGVMIAIDDFGTGYSSLDYLHRFPVNRIKIAQTFVNRLGSNFGDAAIVKATIGLARELNINVIAEGVETPEQFQLLKNWGCGEVQGFHFARPLSVPDITRLLEAGGIILPGSPNAGMAGDDLVEASHGLALADGTPK